jgi:2-dehydro-3-deoxyphosphogalactonate aldolase
VLKAIRAVLPAGVRVLPVGGITPGSMTPWLEAGAAGFGIGSALYSPGVGLDEIARRGRTFVQVVRGASGH